VVNPPAGRLVAAVTVFALVAGLSGCAAGGRPSKPPASVTIGLLAGADAVHGGELAIEVVNNQYRDLALPFGASAGLSRGTRLVLVTGDAKGDPNAAGPAAEDLARRSRAAGVVVADTAEAVRAASQRAEAAVVPLLDATSSADFLGALGRDWYFRVGPTDQALAGAALDRMRESIPGDAVATHRLVVLDGVTGQPSTGPVDLTGPTAGRRFNVAGRVPVAAGANPAELADKINALKPDGVLAIVGSEPEAAAAGDAVQRLKTSVPAVAMGAGLSAGNAARPLQRAAAWSTDYAARNPLARAVGELYQRRYGAPMTEAAARTFTATLTLAVAIDRAGDGDPGRIRAALRALWLPPTQLIMPWDGIQFGPGGQNALAVGVVEQKDAAGTYRLVYPRELAPRV
jgi:branched-chain amino acid transport system substrate-binding protein